MCKVSWRENDCTGLQCDFFLWFEGFYYFTLGRLCLFSYLSFTLVWLFNDPVFRQVKNMDFSNFLISICQPLQTVTSKVIYSTLA